MIWIDYVIIAVVGFSALVSLVRGFVREALSLVTWGCAFFVASHYYAYLAVWFTGFDDELVRNGIAIGVLFVATLIVGAIVNYVIGTLVEKTGLPADAVVTALVHFLPDAVDKHTPDGVLPTPDTTKSA